MEIISKNMKRLRQAKKLTQEEAARCYEELGQYEQAAQVWEDIAGQLTVGGYDAEVEFPRRQAQNCREKISK